MTWYQIGFKQCSSEGVSLFNDAFPTLDTAIDAAEAVLLETNGWESAYVYELSNAVTLHKKSDGKVVIE